MTACTFFRNAQDNMPRMWSGPWDRLADGLQRIRHPQVGLEGDAAKKSLPAFCASTFIPGTTRARDHVTGVHLLLLDFDNSKEEGTSELHPSGRRKTRKVPLEEPIGLETAERLLEQAGVAALAWTTWSAKPAWPKFRVVVPLASLVPEAAWPQAAEWALGALGIEALRAAIDTPVLHNPAALAFLPGAPDSSSIRFFQLEGDPLAVPLARLHAMEVPGPVLPAWEPRRLESRAGEDWWKSYQVDGRPVDFKALDLVPVLGRLGCRVGQPRVWGKGMKRRCSCPWAEEHSGGVDDDAAVLFTEPGKWPSFVCLHSGHAGLGLREVLEAAWGRR